MKMILSQKMMRTSIYRLTPKCGIDIHVVEDFGKEVTYPVNKCLLTGHPDVMEGVEKRAAKAFEGRLSVYRSEDFYVEMMPLGIDKAYGLAKLLQRLGYSRGG